MLGTIACMIEIIRINYLYPLVELISKIIYKNI